MYGAPNALAYLALLGWPVASVVLFAALPARVACLAVLLGGELFLPANFSLPGNFNKDGIATISALLCCATLRASELREARKVRGRPWVFLLLFGGAVGTTLTNRDPVMSGIPIPGESLSDLRQTVTRLLVTWWAPLYLGRKLFRDADHLKLLLRAFALAALVYTPLLLLEIRLSPQLHLWVYGYHQSDFLQSLRLGGYRPKAFMRHGLNVGLFMCVATLAAVGLRRLRIPTAGVPAGFLVVWLTFVLVLCKSSGALVTFLVLALVLWAPPRIRARTALVACCLTLVYPVLRFNGWFPVEDTLAFFESALGPERAQSLQFRFENETLLLERALERPIFGWGSWGRQFVYTEEGYMATIPDGLWVILLGSGGVVQYLAVFGLLLLPVARAARRLAEGAASDALTLSTGLAMGVAYVTDLIPNSGVSPVLTMMMGALDTVARGPDTSKLSVRASTATKPSGDAERSTRAGISVAPTVR